MGPYSHIYNNILGDFKREIQIIPRTPGAGDDKGRATWDEVEPITVKAIVQNVPTPAERGEHGDNYQEPLNVYLSLETEINPHDIIVIDGVRYAIVELHKTDLQIEAQIKKVKV